MVLIVFIQSNLALEFSKNALSDVKFDGNFNIIRWIDERIPIKRVTRGMQQFSQIIVELANK